MSDPKKFIKAFYEAAEMEGLQCDDDSTVFLREAIDAGWPAMM
jgi:hypothetical protein